ncbi:MAG: hypothetical protein IPI19_14005 [Ignavibacteriales bacterium]|mgnify:CR=1 FL=1|nr:hypothetical protein [Ignavibacteriales bacterium]MBP9119929.1 hypothetical protein [Ignavibacterium sp.]
MKKFFVLWVLSAIIGFAQNTTENTPEIKISGFVKSDFFFDSRQVATFREGHFLLYPLNELLDVNGEDINAKASFNALSIQSRVTAKLFGPEVLGAKSGGLIEGEFFGTSDADVNGFRLRHAYVTLNWENTGLLFGQTWHPMFVTDVFPQVVSFNTGSPFQPFSRNPQIRLTQSFDKFNLIAALLTQRDVTSNGPAGFSSSYLRNNLIPSAHLQLQYKSESFVTGAGVDYKSLTPRISTTKNYKTNETVSGLSGLLYAKYVFSGFTWMVEGVYGQNLTDLLMLGGYAVSAVDTATGYEEYTPLNVYSVWTDLSYGKDIQPGIFIGYTRNLGADNKIVGSYSTRVSNIDKIFRITPRVIFNFSKVRFAVETEFTSTSYGKTDEFGKVNDTKDVLNIRGLMAVYYFF